MGSTTVCFLYFLSWYVVPSAPAWSEPWSRSRLARVERDRDGWRQWLVGDDSFVIDDADVQRARLSVRVR